MAQDRDGNTAPVFRHGVIGRVEDKLPCAKILSAIEPGDMISRQTVEGGERAADEDFPIRLDGDGVSTLPFNRAHHLPGFTILATNLIWTGLVNVPGSSRVKSLISVP